MKLIIAGSRHFPADLANRLVKHAVKASGWIDEITIVVHGDCPTGIDAAAQRMCECRWPIEKFPAAWDVYGKAAGPLRNSRMAHWADALILIWDGRSPGSRNMKECAKGRGLRIFEVIHRDDVKPVE